MGTLFYLSALSSLVATLWTSASSSNSWSNILNGFVGNEKDPSRGIIRRIRHHRLPQLQSTILHHTSTRTRVSLESIRPVQNCEIGQTNLIRIAIDNCGQTEIARIDRVMADLELEVAAVIEFRPLEFTIVLDQMGAGVVGGGDRNVLASGRWRRDC